MRSADVRLLDFSKREAADHKKPEIIVINRSAFFRDCFVQCLEVSYNTHLIRSFATVAEWKSHPASGTSPAAMVYFMDRDGASDLQTLEALARNTPVIVMSESDNVDRILRIIKNGARGYIPTSLPFNLVIEALRFVLAGRTFVPVSTLNSSADNQPPSSKPDEIFTQRQISVVEALCKGLANKQIAYQLGMSEHTVKVHLRHVMRRLNARNRTEVAMRARSLLSSDGNNRLNDGAD